MNARLLKETRDLLPVTALGALLVLFPFALRLLLVSAMDREAAATFGLVAMGLGCVLMAGSSFGGEIHQRTLPLLLTQPIARSVLWRDKMLVLAAGLLLILIEFWACVALSKAPHNDWSGIALLLLVPLCAFCGVPYWTLLLRHGIGGMVFAVAAPSWVLILATYLTEQVFELTEDWRVWIAVGVTLVYSATVYSLGYRRFQTMEDRESRSRDLKLPAGLDAVVSQSLSRCTARLRGVFPSLLKKEFRIQQVCFLLAALFFLIAAAGFSLIKLRENLASGIIGIDFAIYVFVLPLVAGAITVGEERSWGIVDWHLTLPPSGYQQWTAKVLTALSVSFALGLLLPAAMVLAGGLMLSKPYEPPPWPEWGFVPLLQVLVTSVAIYVSTFARNSLRAILGAFVLIAAGVAAVPLAALVAEHVVNPTWRFRFGPSYSLGVVIVTAAYAALTLLLCLVQFFAWQNFRRNGASPRSMRVQISSILTFVWLVAFAIASVVIAAQRSQYR